MAFWAVMVAEEVRSEGVQHESVMMGYCPAEEVGLVLEQALGAPQSSLVPERGAVRQIWNQSHQARKSRLRGPWVV